MFSLVLRDYVESMERKFTENEKKMKRLLNRLMVAERYNVSPKTISQWVYLGKIPYIRMKGHHVMFDLDELERWERENAHAERS